MLDPKNLEAVFISFGLTLWDALPVFLVVGIAGAIVVRAILRGTTFARVWVRRRLIGIPGAAYLFLLGSDLLTVYLIIIFVALAASVVVETVDINWSKEWGFYSRSLQRIPFTLTRASSAPPSESRAVTSTVSMLFSLVFAAAAITAVLKVYGSELDWSTGVWTALAVTVAFLSGLPPGAAAIPATSIASVSGSELPGIAWLIAAALLETVRVILDLSQEKSFTAVDTSETTKREDERASPTSSR